MTAPEVLWCPNTRIRGGNGWAFPPAVDRQLRALTAGRRVYHPFGGRARFGVRGDIDPIVRPDVVADAWLPPFVQDAFDVVVLDPPYVYFSVQMQQHLLRAAAYIARDQVIWFHTMWIASGGKDRLVLDRSWLVRVGDSCAVRCLQVFRVGPGAKTMPRAHFTSGPAIRYNRWLAGQDRLPLRAGGLGMTARLRALLCVLAGGHEFYRAWSPNRLYQRCVICGHVTRGWDVTPALRFRSTWMHSK